jgi:hypothetical protein
LLSVAEPPKFIKGTLLASGVTIESLEVGLVVQIPTLPSTKRPAAASDEGDKTLKPLGEF